jgi:hypothetical protein
MKVRVLYWKDAKRRETNTDNIPTLEDIRRDYVPVYDGKMLHAKLDNIHAILNTIPRDFIGELPPGVQHYMMSTGDIIELDGECYVKLPVGWTFPAGYWPG